MILGNVYQAGLGTNPARIAAVNAGVPYEVRFKTVGILGTGTIGTSLASFYASRGLKVRLFDSNSDALAASAGKVMENLRYLLKFDLVDEKTFKSAEKNLEPVKSIPELVEDVQFVHECVLERYDVKKEVFTVMDQHADASAVIASSSSGLLMTEIQKVMKHPQRSLIAHPFNPPHLVPLMELAPGKQTDPATLRTVYDFFKGVGKLPVILKKEVPGHIANRLAAALWREAVDLVASGVASVEDVDKALYAGPGIRWAFMGQHLIYHLGGGESGYKYFIEHIGVEFSKYWKGMATWTQIPEEAKKAIITGVKDSVGDTNISDLTKWRDEKLVELRKAIYGKKS